MARGLRREVRNDAPAVGETREQMYERRRQEWMQSQLPSRNRASRRFTPPPGCIDVYRVCTYDGTRNEYFGVYRDENEAYREADKLWMAQAGYRTVRHKYRVEHKAAIQIEGRFYIVNLVPLKFTPPAEGLCVLVGGSGVQQEEVTQ